MEQRETVYIPSTVKIPKSHIPQERASVSEDNAFSDDVGKTDPVMHSAVTIGICMVLLVVGVVAAIKLRPRRRTQQRGDSSLTSRQNPYQGVELTQVSTMDAVLS